MPVTIHLRAANGQFVCAEGGGGGTVVANRDVAKTWETLALVGVDAPQVAHLSKVALETYNGSIVCAEGGGGGQLNATRKLIKKWETFTMLRTNGAGPLKSGDSVAFQTYGGNYLCAEKGGGKDVVANRTTVGSWETFKVEFAPYCPDSIDHGPHLGFVRHQGAYGCGMFAIVDAWDIVNEIRTPYCPNLSVNRILWAWRQKLWGQKIPGPGGKQYSDEDEMLIDLGCCTEGTELTDSDAVRWTTGPGDLEAPNYRFKSRPAQTPVGIQNFRALLNNQQPFRGQTTSSPKHVPANHFIAFVGYDDATQRFKYANSYGDKWGEGGFGYVDYKDLREEIETAQVIDPVPPPVVPTLRVAFSHEYRQDVFLWLRADGSSKGRRIWPSGQWQDDSGNLQLTVTLPVGYKWPPSSNNRLILDLYDSGLHGNKGGKLLTLTAANGKNQLFKCKALNSGPVPFSTGNGNRWTVGD